MCIACDNDTAGQDMCLADPIGARPACIKPKDHAGAHENVHGDTWNSPSGDEYEIIDTATGIQIIARLDPTARASTILVWEDNGLPVRLPFSAVGPNGSNRHRFVWA